MKKLVRDYWLYLMLIPGITYFVIFKYMPMWGVFISMYEYQPFLGFLNSPWVGFRHFERLFADQQFWKLFTNTLTIAIYNLVFYFPLPILLSLMMNEMMSNGLKRTIQSIIYMPHFMSWVVIYSLCVVLTSPTSGGFIAIMMEKITGSPVNVLASAKYFRTVVVLQSIWKECGWGTIIFMAALTAIDPQLYEAARIDGANRFQQNIHITLPGIRGTIVTLLLLRIGRMLDTSFEQIYLMLNSMNRSVGNVFDTFVYDAGVKQGQYSYSTAVGLFKSLVCLILVVSSNWLSKKLGEEGLF